MDAGELSVPETCWRYLFLSEKMQFLYSFCFVRRRAKFKTIQKALFVSICLMGFVILFNGDYSDMIEGYDLLRNVNGKSELEFIVFIMLKPMNRK